MIFNRYFWPPLEENNDDNLEDEEEVEEEPQEEQEEEEDSSSSQEEEKAEVEGSNPWRPLRQKVGQDLKETFLKEVQQFLERC